MVSKRKTIMEYEMDPQPSTKKRVRMEVNDDEAINSIVRKKKVKKTKEKTQQPQQQQSDVENESNLETAKTVETVNINPDLPNWPVADISELLRRLESILPQFDNLLYKSRVEKLNWNDIAFDDYSGVDCRLMWDSIQKRVRRFRILRELVDDAKGWLAKPWTNFYRSNKTNRHPDMPRRPLSTYMLFYMKKKDKVLKEHPGLEMTDLSKYIAELYKKLSPKVKKKYTEIAAADRKEYNEKIKEFYRLHPDLVTNKSKRSSNDDIPYKPQTPFKLFCEDKLKHCEQDADFDKAAFIERCKEQWKSLSDKKKVFWINWAQEEMKKYATENPDYVPTAGKSILTKEERTIQERMAGKPEKPPNSAYSLFSRLMLSSDIVKQVTPKERMLLIAQQWKDLGENEKKEYADRVKHMLEQYKLQYAEYLESLSEDKRQEELLNNQPKKKRIVKTVKSVNTASDTTAATTTKRTKKKTKIETITKKTPENLTIPKPLIKKDNSLYEGEPVPPPIAPYMVFLKEYEKENPNKQNAHDVWENMIQDERDVYRYKLVQLKKVYIEKYEKFLKGLSQDELKQYFKWKNSAKLVNENSDMSDDDTNNESEQEYSSDSEDETNQNRVAIKHEKDDSSESYSE